MATPQDETARTAAAHDCQLCTYLRYGGAVGEYPPCRDNAACATAANTRQPCPCRTAAATTPRDATARIAAAHEAAFAALSEAEQNERYARFEAGTAGAWLATYGG